MLPTHAATTPDSFDLEAFLESEPREPRAREMSGFTKWLDAQRGRGDELGWFASQARMAREAGLPGRTLQQLRKLIASTGSEWGQRLLEEAVAEWQAREPMSE